MRGGGGDGQNLHVYNLFLHYAFCKDGWIHRRFFKTKINAHNREILRNTPSKNVKHCNCQLKENCPMNGACLKESLVYYATISCNNNNNKPKLYKGSCEASFKKRSSNHKKSFNLPLYKHDTKLSTEYLNLKTKQVNPRISWKIKGI